MKVYIVKYESGDMFQIYEDRMVKIFLDRSKAVEYVEGKGAVYNESSKTWDVQGNYEGTYEFYNIVEMEVVE